MTLAQFLALPQAQRDAMVGNSGATRNLMSSVPEWAQNLGPENWWMLDRMTDYGPDAPTPIPITSGDNAGEVAGYRFANGARMGQHYDPKTGTYWQPRSTPDEIQAMQQYDLRGNPVGPAMSKTYGATGDLSSVESKVWKPGQGGLSINTSSFMDPGLAAMLAVAGGFGAAGMGAFGGAGAASAAPYGGFDAAALGGADFAGGAAAGLPNAGMDLGMFNATGNPYNTGVLAPGAGTAIQGAAAGGTAAAGGAVSGLGGAAGSAAGASGQAAGGLLGGLSNGSMIGAGLGAAAGLLGGGNSPAGSTTPVQDIPDWLKPYVTSNLQGAQGVLGRTTQPSSLIPSAEAEMQKTISGQYLMPGQNPYLDATFNQAARQVTDTYKNTTQPRTDAIFNGPGSLGGNTAYQSMVGRNQWGLGENLSSLATSVYGGNYQNERNRQFGAASGAPAFSGQSTQAQFAPYQSMNSLFPNIRSETQPYFSNQMGGLLGGAMTGAALGRMF